jgi:hypothetical protein
VHLGQILHHIYGFTNPVPLPHRSEPYLQHPSGDKRLDDHGQTEHGDHRR